jgi:orotate phosphoribosyltransferase
MQKIDPEGICKIFFETKNLVNIQTKRSIEVQPGVFSSIYINLKSPLSDPISRKKLCLELDKIISKKTDFICGIESGGNYFASAIADLKGSKLIFFRKETKKYNIKNRIVGALPNKTDRVIIVDDVISSGNTVAKAVNELKKLGCKLEVIVIFSYCWEKIISKNLGVKISRLLDAKQFLKYGLEREKISKRDAALILEYINDEEKRVYKK